jgi:hypothetical protein
MEDFPGSKPTVKQKLAAVRMFYDFLVVRQIMPSNPAHSVLEVLQELLGFLYAECCTRNKAIEPGKIFSICK